MNTPLPESLLNAQKAGVEYFMGEACEWKFELKGPVKRIEEFVGCLVYAFADNGFGDHLFLKHNGLKWVASTFRNGELGPLVDPRTGKLRKVRFVERGQPNNQ